MNFSQTVLLGAIAGFTIYLGLPIGRIERVLYRNQIDIGQIAWNP
jgi:hypothetical protein